MKKSGLALAFGAFALAGCASIGGPGVSSYYDCGNDTRLKVDYIGDDTVQVQVNNDRPILLRQVASASGAKYGGAQQTFWTKGDEATWTVGRMVPMECRTVIMPR